VEIVEIRLAGRARRSRGQRLRSAVERHIFALRADPYADTEVLPRASEQAQPTLFVWLSEQPPSNERGERVMLRHDGRAEPTEIAFRRAVLSRNPTVTTEVILADGQNAITAERTVSAVGPVSETLSRTLALWKIAALMPRAVERLPGLNERVVAPESHDPAPSAVLQMRDVTSWLRAPIVRLLYRRPWWIQVRERTDSPTSDWETEAPLVRWGDGRMYADPFIFEHEGRHHLFCEEVPRNAKQGIISHTELRLDGEQAEPPTPVLQLPFHLSYPCVFAHGGEVYMIPETNAVRRIELYRASTFPKTWERETTLVDGVNAVDTTLFEQGGRLWLFTAVAAEGASYSDELHLFWADALHGPWHPHPGNPVVSDVAAARPAGAIQMWGDRIVRPVQDCRRRYGWAVSFREVDVLSSSDYAEHEIDRLEPLQLRNARATHTYAADSRFEAIDLRRRELRARHLSVVNTLRLAFSRDAQRPPASAPGPDDGDSAI
jgi:hypothetical protein